MLTVVGMCNLKLDQKIVSYLGKRIAAETCEASQSVCNTEEITRAGSYGRDRSDHLYVQLSCCVMCPELLWFPSLGNIVAA